MNVTGCAGYEDQDKCFTTLGENIMDETKKDSGARAALKAIENELSDLHYQKRIDADLINNQQQQIKALREESTSNVDYWREVYIQTCIRLDQNEKIIDRSIMSMFTALVIAFVAIGYAVWVGS